MGGEEGPPFGCHRLFKVGEIPEDGELGATIAENGGYLAADVFTQLVDLHGWDW